MSAGRMMVEEVRKIAILGGRVSGSVHVDFAPLRLVAEVVLADQLSCLVSEISVRATDGQVYSTDELRVKGDDLCHRLSYLLEPIRVLEVDAMGGEVQARSQPPDRQPDRIRYYELRFATPSTLKLQRFEKQVGPNQRHQIPLQLTYELLEKLMNDLVKAF